MNLFKKVEKDNDLKEIGLVLNKSHLTIANEFGFTKETNPTNNAFIDPDTLRDQLNKGIELYQMTVNNNIVGCIAIEKSHKEAGTYYIEKVSVLPEHRHNGYGIKLMEYASDLIKGRGGKVIAIALIEENTRLKEWYRQQGFNETAIKKFDHLPFTVCFMNKNI